MPTVDNRRRGYDYQPMPNGTRAIASSRKAVAVDDDIKAGNLRRLRRIEGQVQGLQRMVEADRYCPDILMQVSSVEEALRGVSKELIRNHLKHCARKALRGDLAAGDAAIEELLTVWSRHAR